MEVEAETEVKEGGRRRRRRKESGRRLTQETRTGNVLKDV
jgi:hypothetical protein